MEFEMNDLKGILFFVLLKIISITSSNIDCNGKAFHCLNSTHFMICVDLGSGISMTLDDFVISCPQGTVCERHNRFECEYPKISITIYPLEVIDVTKRSDTKTDEIGKTTDEYASRELLIHGSTLSTNKVTDDVITLSNIITEENTESSTSSNIAAPEITTARTVFDENDIANIKTKSNTRLYSPKLNVYNMESVIEATIDKPELKISMQGIMNKNMTTNNNNINIINKTMSNAGKFQTNFSNTSNISNFSKPIQQPIFLLKQFMNHNSNRTQTENETNQNNQQLSVSIRNSSEILSDRTSIIEQVQTTTLSSSIFTFSTSSVQTKNGQDVSATTTLPTIILTTPNDVLTTDYSINGLKTLFRSQTDKIPLTELIKTTETSITDIILLRNRINEFEHEIYINDQNWTKDNIDELFTPKISSDFIPINTSDKFTSDSTVSSIIFYDQNLSSINFTTARALTNFSNTSITDHLQKVANETATENEFNSGFESMNQTNKSNTETTYMKDANLNKYLNLESVIYSNNSLFITTTEIPLSINLIEVISTEFTNFQNAYDDKNLITEGPFQTDNIKLDKKLDTNVKDMPLVSMNLMENLNSETTTKRTLLKSSKEQLNEKFVFNSSFTESFPKSTLSSMTVTKVLTETLLADHTDSNTVKKANENNTGTILVNSFLMNKNAFTDDLLITQKNISLIKPAHFSDVYITENPITKPSIQTYSKDLSNVKITTVQEKLSSTIIYEHSDNETTTEKLSNPTNKTEIFAFNYSITPSMRGNYDQSLPITDDPMPYVKIDKTSKSDIEDVSAYGNNIAKIITEDVTNQYLISDLESIVSTNRSEITNIQDGYKYKSQKIETLATNPNKNSSIQVFEMTIERPQLIETSNQTTVNNSTASQTQLTIMNEENSDKTNNIVNHHSSNSPVEITVYQDITTLRTKGQENSDNAFIAMTETSFADEAITIPTQDTYSHDVRNIAKISMSEAANQSNNTNQSSTFELNSKTMYSLTETSNDTPIFEITTAQSLLMNTRETLVLNSSFREVPSATLLPIIDVNMLPTKTNHTFLTEYKDANIITIENDNSTDGILGNYFLANETRLLTQRSISTTKYISDVTTNPIIESLTFTYYNHTHKNIEEENSTEIINNIADPKTTTEKFLTTIFKTEGFISNFSKILGEQGNVKHYTTTPSVLLYENSNKTLVSHIENNLTRGNNSEKNATHNIVNKNVTFDSEFAVPSKNLTEISNIQRNFIDKHKSIITDFVIENINKSLPTEINQITKGILKKTGLSNERTVINSIINQTRTVEEIIINSDITSSAKVDVFTPIFTMEVDERPQDEITSKIMNENINQEYSDNEFMATTETYFSEALSFSDQVSTIPSQIAKSEDSTLKEQLIIKTASVNNLKNDRPPMTPNKILFAKPIIEQFVSSADDYSPYYEQPKVTTTLEITKKVTVEPNITNKNNIDEKQIYESNYKFTQPQKITNDIVTTAVTDMMASIVPTNFHRIENVTKHQIIYACAISAESISTPSIIDYKGEFSILNEKPTTEVLITYFNVTAVDKETEQIHVNNSTIIRKNYSNSYNKHILEKSVISENNISYPITNKVAVDTETSHLVASTLFTEWFNNSYVTPDITKHDHIANISSLPIELVNDKVNTGYYNSNTEIEFSRTIDTPITIDGIINNQLSTEYNETKNTMKQKNILQQAQETKVFNSSVKDLSILDILAEPINRKVNNINDDEKIKSSVKNLIAASKTNMSSILENEYNAKSPYEYRTRVGVLLTDSLTKSEIDGRDNSSQVIIKVDEPNKDTATISIPLNDELPTTQYDIKTNQNVNPFTLDQSGIFTSKLDAKGSSNPLITLQSKTLTQKDVTVRTKLKTNKSMDNDFNRTKVNETDYNLVSTHNSDSNLLFNLSSERINHSIPILSNINDIEEISENKYNTQATTNEEMTSQIVFPNNVSVNENVYDFLNNLTDEKTVDKPPSRERNINTYPVKTSTSETASVVSNHQTNVELIHAIKLKNYTITNTNVSEVHKTSKTDNFNHNTSEVLPNISPLPILIYNSQKHVINLKPHNAQSSYINPLPTKLTHFNNPVNKSLSLLALDKLMVQKNINNNTKHNDSYNNAYFQIPTTTERANDVNTLKQEINNTKLYLDTRNVSYENNIVNSTFNCMFRGRGKYPDNINCQKFYICIGQTQPMIKACPPNTVFSHIYRHCTNNLSHCVRNNQFRCLIEGRFGDFFQSNVYYICVKSSSNRFVRYKLQCLNGYYLNKITVKCEPNLDTSSLSSNSVSINENSQKSNENSQKTSGGNNENFQCEKVGKFPDSNDCTKYYVCTRNESSSMYRQIIKQCSFGEVFHSEMKKCVESESYEC